MEIRKEKFLVKKVGKKKFSVLSLNSTSGNPRQYCVQFNGYRWLCNCPHFLQHSEDVNFACKHIIAVMLSQAKAVTIKRRVKELSEQIVFA